MKKALLALLIMFVLLWNCGTVVAKNEAKEKKRRGPRKHAARVDRRTKARRVDVNEPGDREQRRLEMLKRRRAQLKMREARGKGKERLKGRPDLRPPVEELAKGKEHQQQLKAFEAQMAKEVAKHRRRLARLKRIRELAVEDNNTKTVERVDKLLRKEQMRYRRKGRRMQIRKQRALQLSERTSGKEARPAKRTADTEESKAKERKKVRRSKRKAEDTAEADE